MTRTDSSRAAVPGIHTTAGKLVDLRDRLAQARIPSGEIAIQKVHAKGKLTARERITALLDEGSFVEMDALARHRSQNFGLADNRPYGDGSSPATAPSTDATSASSPRTPPSSAAPSAKFRARKSSKSWTSPSKPDAVGFVYRTQLLDAAKNGDDVDVLRRKLQQEYEDTLVNPYVAAERGYLDAVIPHTRGQIVSALRLLDRKHLTLPPKKHGNIPL